MMTQKEIEEWAVTMAEDCFRYSPPAPLDEAKARVVTKLGEAYRHGIEDAQAGR